MNGRAGLRLALGFAGVYFLALYLLPPFHEYNSFRLVNFDYGMVYQSTYLLSELRELFMTCRGVHAWADNQDYFQLLVAPFHHLPGPQYWVLGVHSLGIYACGVFCLAWLWKTGRFEALSVAVAVWASPFLLNMNADLVHTESFATLLILLLYWAAKRGRTALFYVFLIAAFTCKEDVALTLGLFLVLALLERKRFELDPRHLAFGTVLVVALFFVNLKVILPYYKVETCLWLNPGMDPAAISPAPAAAAFSDVLANWYKPAFLFERFVRLEVGLYVLKVMWPALLFVRRWSWLFFIPAAGMFVNVAADSDFLIEGYHHYDFATFAGVLVFVLEALSETRNRRAATTVLMVGALGVALATEKMRVPLYAPLTPSFYALAKDERVVFLEQLAAALPEDTVISADERSMNYLLEGHPNVFMFKNPFESAYFGLYGQCISYAEAPSVDIVVIRADGEKRRERARTILPAEYVEVEPPRALFHVWLSPAFAASPAADAARAVLDG
jgi:uncharacterized membrane protein